MPPLWIPACTGMTVGVSLWISVQDRSVWQALCPSDALEPVSAGFEACATMCKLG